jgi:hypothetical protein
MKDDGIELRVLTPSSPHKRRPEAVRRLVEIGPRAKGK